MAWSNDFYNFILTDLQLTTALTWSISYRSSGVAADPSGRAVYFIIIIIINILTAIGLAPGGSSPVHFTENLYTEYTNNAQDT